MTAVEKVGYLTHAGSSNSHNSFSSDGYDAFGVGCEDRECPEFFGNSFPYWFIGVIAGLLIIVVGVGTTLYIRHRRAQRSRAAGQQAQGQQGSEGGQQGSEGGQQGSEGGQQGSEGIQGEEAQAEARV